MPRTATRCVRLSNSPMAASVSIRWGEDVPIVTSSRPLHSRGNDSWVDSFYRRLSIVTGRPWLNEGVASEPRAEHDQTCEDVPIDSCTRTRAPHARSESQSAAFGLVGLLGGLSRR